MNTVIVHQIRQRAARNVAAFVHEPRISPRLRSTITRDTCARFIDERGLPGEPHRFAALCNDRRRKGTALLKIRAFEGINFP